MNTMDPIDTITGSVEKFVGTGFEGDQLTTNPSVYAQTYREDWQEVIDYTLIEWGKDPSKLKDEDFKPPTIKSITKAIGFAKETRDKLLPPPLRTVPNGDGGIVFERRDGEIFQKLEVDENGQLEFSAFENSKLILTTGNIL